MGYLKPKGINNKGRETMVTLRNKIISVGTAMALLCMTSGLPEALAKRGGTSINVIPTITSVSLVNGVLVATGTATATIHGQTTTEMDAPFVFGWWDVSASMFSF
jgi:hypothetical protein